MGQGIGRIVLSIGCALALGTSALYSEKVYAETGEDGQTAEYELPQVTVEAPRPKWEEQLSPGSVSVVYPAKMKGEHKNLPDLLKAVPGIHIRKLAGSGQYTVVTIRGSSSSQVGIFIDGVLANLGGDAAVDLSAIPVENVERIEVYRGYIPARFGGTYMGGVINIVTKKPQQTGGSVSAGLRSWGGLQGSVNINAPLGDGSLLFGFNRDESDGDFRYENLEMHREYGPKMTSLYTRLTTINSNIAKYQGILADPASTPAQITSAKKNLNTQLKNLANQNELIDFYSKLSSERHRMSNSYKKTDALLKWQDEHWQIKGSWRETDRMLPCDIASGVGLWDSIDNPNPFQVVQFPQRQQLTEKGVLIGRRQTSGNLDWGWRLDYLNQEKNFRKYFDPGPYTPKPLSIWSQFRSERTGGAVDGSYQAGTDHLLEFMANYSRESLKVDGNDIEQRTDMKDRYTQTLWNAQLQDTITLNKARDFWFTPSVRHNSSTGLGEASAFVDSRVHWVQKLEETKGSKTTWAMALKKQLGEHWTLRSTYGSYYRFPNLYELVGDGAWILPNPDGVVGPEHGTQWDFGAGWQGELLRAKADMTITYFGRRSDNIITLNRRGFDYFSFMNEGKGKVNGVELESNLTWQRWDLNVAATYLKTKDLARTIWSGSSYIDNYFYGKSLPDHPEWEGQLRLTYRLPGERASLFAELHYTDKVFIGSSTWQTALTTVGLGGKYNFKNGLKLVAGVNDLFNKGPEMEEYTVRPDWEASPRNPDYPVQGRTYYATLQWEL